MAKAARSNSLPPREVLEKKKSDLTKRVDELERRKALTDDEAFELKQLKKEKLAAKDQLESAD